LQLINEPEDNRALEGWYKSTLSELRSIVPAEFPLYVGDAWNADKFASWVGSRGDFVVLDTHVYRAFTDGDKRMTGEQHAHKLRTQEINDFGRQSEAAKGSLVVCEWSGALDHGIYGNAPDTEKDRQSRMFVAAELEVFEKHMGWPDGQRGMRLKRRSFQLNYAGHTRARLPKRRKTRLSIKRTVGCRR
jgi:hypothetical protein